MALPGLLRPFTVASDEKPAIVFLLMPFPPAVKTRRRGRLEACVQGTVGLGWAGTDGKMHSGQRKPRWKRQGELGLEVSGAESRSPRRRSHCVRGLKTTRRLDPHQVLAERLE